MNKPGRIDVINLMPELDKLLFNLLEGLSVDDWEVQTIASKWNVKDVAVHLLDGNLRTLSMLRDGYYGDKPDNINSYEKLIGFLNRLNADWVIATKRLSPQVIINLLKSSGKEYCEFLKTLNPEDNAGFSVAWAGENDSKNWFHIAREYTEKWHHQQQIRLAIGEEKELLKDKWYLPYLETSVRALPHHYRDLEGRVGGLIKFTFVSKTLKNWYLTYTDKWELISSNVQSPDCEVRIKDEIAWKIFTNGIKKNEAIRKSEIFGNKKLGEKIFDMLAVMA